MDPKAETPRLILAEQSKDELIDEILRLRQRNQELEAENEALKGKTKSAYVQETGYQKKKRWKKLGRPEGHPGCTRPKPEVIDYIVEQSLKKCPDCGHESLIELPTELETHIQEDIVPARVEATKFIRHGYGCTHCKKKQKAPYAPGEIPKSYLGPNILTETVLLKYFHGLPYSKIQLLFSKKSRFLKPSEQVLLFTPMKPAGRSQRRFFPRNTKEP